MSNGERVLTGLPLESYEWLLEFELEGVAADPTDIVIIITRERGGDPFEVDRLAISDLSHTATGSYILSMTPETYGIFEVQIYTSGDTQTVHKSISFNVPKPLGQFP